MGKSYLCDMSRIQKIVAENFSISIMHNFFSIVIIIFINVCYFFTSFNTF